MGHSYFWDSLDILVISISNGSISNGLVVQLNAFSSHSKETRQYLIWDKEGTEDSEDVVCAELFRAAEQGGSDKEDSRKEKKSKKSKKKKASGKKDHGRKKKKKSSSSSDSESESESDSGSSKSSSSSSSEAGGFTLLIWWCMVYVITFTNFYMHACMLLWCSLVSDIMRFCPHGTCIIHTDFNVV